MRRTLILIAGLAALLGACPAARAGNTQAEAQVAALDAGLIAAMKAGRATPFRVRFDMLAAVIDRVFDLPAILQASVGAGWARFAPDQQAALLTAFRAFTVCSYVANFDGYAGEKLDIVAGERPVGAELVVPTRLTPATGDPVRLDYVMRQDGDTWRIVDVLLDATISRVAVQRSDFRALLAQGGAPALLASLRRKIAALSGGAAPT